MKSSKSPRVRRAYAWHPKRDAIRLSPVVVAELRGVSIVVKGHRLVEAAPGGVDAAQVLEVILKSDAELSSLERFCARISC